MVTPEFHSNGFHSASETTIVTSESAGTETLTDKSSRRTIKSKSLHGGPGSDGQVSSRLVDGYLRTNSDNYPTSTPRNPIRHVSDCIISIFDRWWWWEICAMVISISSTASLIGLLAYLSDKALDEWDFLIQPNSLISILVTVAKTTLMVPLASCIGQLKWSHFSKRPDSLSKVQTFDEASRGPWGALMLLLQSPRGQDVLVYGFALATLVALAIDPAAQQILAFPTREAMTISHDVQLSVAKGWVDLFGDSEEEQLPSYVLSSLTLEDAVAGRTQRPYFSCPESATQCRFPPHKTVGICSSVVNATEKVECNERNCTAPTIPGLSEWRLDFTESSPQRVFQWSPYVEGGRIAPNSSFEIEFGIVRMPHSVFNSNHNYTWFQNRGFGNYDALSVEAFEASIYPCMQTYDAANLSSSSPGMWKPSSTERLHSSYNESADQVWLTEPSTGSMYPGGKTMHWGSIGDVALLFTTLDYNMVMNGTAEYNRISTEGDFYKSLVAYMGNVSEIFSNATLSATNMFRPGPTEGNSAAHIAYGEIVLPETYINVRWPWAIVPLVEAVFIAGLLTLTIIATRGSNDALLKNSVLGLLFHGIEGWTARDTRQAILDRRVQYRRDGGEKVVDEGENETEGLLGKVAGDMRVRFCDDEDLGRRFVHVSS